MGVRARRDLGDHPASLNGWRHRSPERRSESHRSHSIFSGNSPGHGPQNPAHCPAPSRCCRTLQPASHTGGKGHAPQQNICRKHLQAQRPGQNFMPAVPTPPTRLRGQSHTTCLSPWKRAAGLILTRVIGIHVQSHEKALWTVRSARTLRPALSV